MNNFLILQLIISFIIGGGLVAFLSILAENSSEKVAGLIIAFPSTIAISFFFIGWTISPQKVSEVATIVPITIGIMMVFNGTYLYLSKIKLKKTSSILLCSIGSLGIWFLLTVPLALMKFSDLFLSLLGYIVLTIFGYYFITIKPKEKSTHTLVKYSTSQKIIRACFAGLIISFAVFSSKSFGPLWGGIFTGFPAVFFSSITTLHYHYDSHFLFKIWKNTPIGSIPLVIYTIIAKYAFPSTGIFYGTILAYIGSIGAFYLITKIKKSDPK